MNRSTGPVRLLAIIAAFAMLGMIAGGASLMTPAGASAQSTTGPTITGIDASCAGGGVLYVSNAIGGSTVTLQLTYHIPGDATFYPTGYTTTITMIEGQTSYAFAIDLFTGVPAEANTIRVEVLSTSGADFGGTTTKSVSFGPCGTAPTATNVPTNTPTNTATNTPTNSPTNTATNTATNTPTVSTPTQTGGEEETPVPTATNTPVEIMTATPTVGTPTQTGGEEETPVPTATNTPVEIMTATPTVGTPTQTGGEEETPVPTATATVPAEVTQTITGGEEETPVSELPSTGSAPTGGGMGGILMALIAGAAGLAGLAYASRRRA